MAGIVEAVTSADTAVGDHPAFIEVAARGAAICAAVGCVAVGWAMAEAAAAAEVLVEAAAAEVTVEAMAEGLDSTNARVSPGQAGAG